MNLWHNSRLLNLVANLLFAVALLVLLVAGAWWVSQRPFFNLRGVSIEASPGFALRHVSAQGLRFSGRRYVQGNFFTVRLEEVRNVFEAVPWVRRANVRRIWPNRLVIAIEEHRPLALWGEDRLVNTYGEVFTANLDEAEEDGALPTLAGPAGSEQQVVRLYDDLRRWLSPLGRSPEQLVLSARHAWTVRLDDGMTLLLGRDQGTSIEQRVKGWARVFEQVQARLDRKPEVIDLRYPNGFAMRSVAVLAAEQTRNPLTDSKLTMGGSRVPAPAGPATR